MSVNRSPSVMGSEPLPVIAWRWGEGYFPRSCGIALFGDAGGNMWKHAQRNFTPISPPF